MSLKQATETGAINVNTSRFICRIGQKLNSDIVNTKDLKTIFLLTLEYKTKKFRG